MISSQNRLVWAVPALLLFSGACGDDTPVTPTDTTTTTTTTATVTVAAAPEPAVAVESTDPAYAWSVSFVATITNGETSGLTVQSISTELQQSSGGIVIEPATGTDESFRFVVRAPGNRIDPSGTLAIPFTFFYTLPSGGREAIVRLTFLVGTDAGASGTISTTVNLQ